MSFNPNLVVSHEVNKAFQSNNFPRWFYYYNFTGEAMGEDFIPYGEAMAYHYSHNAVFEIIGADSKSLGFKKLEIDHSTRTTKLTSLELENGSSVVVDYNALANKPQVNGKTLNSGNNTADSLDLQNKLTFDNVPTLNSENVVKSGGVYAADLAERTAREIADDVLSQRVSAQEGLGGYLPMYDFGVETPTQQELTDYAMANISTATVPADIFNGTRVTNSYDNLTWVLTNTPNTTPSVFEWAIGYNNAVNRASNSTLGIVQGSTDIYGVSVDNINGKLKVNTGGKVFSTEDFTTADEFKLSTIAEFAQVNKIDSISINGTDVVPDTEKKANITIDKQTVGLSNVDNISVIDILKLVYPVGSIFFSSNSSMPSVYLGFGDWERYADGRVLVGVDTSQTEFNTFNKTGGSKVHTLTVNEMPKHTHKVRKPNGSTGGAWRYTIAEDNNNAATMDPFVEILYGTSLQETGEGQSHNNLQPYVTCYIWRRIS